MLQCAREEDGAKFDGGNDGKYLDGHLDDGLANKSCAKEGCERNAKVTTRDTRQIKQLHALRMRTTPDTQQEHIRVI